MKTFCSLFGVLLLGQMISSAGLVNVVATDHQDKPVQYAEVTLMNMQTKAIVRKETDRYGVVRMGWVQSGNYRLMAAHQGKPGERKDLEVGVAPVNVRVKATGVTPAQ